MYDNVGRSIKSLSKVIAAIGCIICFIWGISQIISAQELADYSSEMAGVMTTNGFLIMAIGALVSIVASFFMYGFGHIIECVQNIENKLCGNDRLQEEIANLKQEALRNQYSNNAKNNTGVKPSNELVDCIKCGNKVQNDLEFCPHCGIKRVVRKH